MDRRRRFGPGREGLGTNAKGFIILVLSRQRDEGIIIDHKIKIVVVDIRSDRVRLGIECPRDITVHREEVEIAIQREESRDDRPDVRRGEDED